ncbi:substrate-binding domain-containing protein [Vibrio hangzhouensis]|uniref:substrate-binding domain-containing protein n=1 Tax=Vibrio hangzhouensis TaxID=462991 RepID=UPI001C97536B|nr:substrate-binding domain-containing protein [Vibrio hangzhouensis]MBY6196045.1 substrate-binding domain-containing protein [Vibrio hangzhouensis]
MVTIGCTDIDHPNIHCIKNSSLVGGYMATNHLLRLGHTNIVYLSGIHFHPDSKYRRLGYRQALEKAGLTYDPERVISGHFNVESGRKAVEKLQAQKLPFTAIFAANDQMAFGAIQALENAGVRVPQHVSVIGFDDHEVSSAFTPALTTIRQPSIQFGRSAALHLAHILGVIVDESETRCDEDSVRVVIRHSCSPCRQ